MSAFWNSTLRVRRKPHRCETCGQQVQSGERSYDEAGEFDGSISSFKQCRACHDLAAYFFWRGTFEYSEGYQFEWLAEEARADGLIWPPVFNYIADEPARKALSLSTALSASKGEGE